jgi:hypothetical protein
VRYVPAGSLCTASAEQIFPRDSVQRYCFELALYTARDHDCISNRIGSGTRTCPRCGCQLATFGALPTPSTIYREIIMLNNHRFWGHASGSSSSSGKTLSSFHPLLARPCRSALPRERFSPLTLSGNVPRRKSSSLYGELPSHRNCFGFSCSQKLLHEARAYPATYLHLYSRWGGRVASYRTRTAPQIPVVGFLSGASRASLASTRRWSTVIVAARPCGVAAHETDGTTTCIGIPNRSPNLSRHRRRAAADLP